MGCKIYVAKIVQYLKCVLFGVFGNCRMLNEVFYFFDRHSVSFPSIRSAVLGNCFVLSFGIVACWLIMSMIGECLSKSNVHAEDIRCCGHDVEPINAYSNRFYFLVRVRSHGNERHGYLIIFGHYYLIGCSNL